MIERKIEEKVESTTPSGKALSMRVSKGWAERDNVKAERDNVKAERDNVKSGTRQRKKRNATT